MMYATITLASVVAGIIQSVTGFGSAVFLMLIVPYFFDMVASSAISASIALGLSGTLAWKFRSKIQWKLCLFPTAIYMVCSVAVINVIRGLDLRLLSIAFGIFLILLAVYFFVVAKRLSFQPNWKSACICSAISGVTSGLFGIGGPLMAAFFVLASQDKKNYIANTQFLFAATGLVNLITRITRDIYNCGFDPYHLVGPCWYHSGQAYRPSHSGATESGHDEKGSLRFCGYLRSDHCTAAALIFSTAPDENSSGAVFFLCLIGYAQRNNEKNPFPLKKNR